MSVKAPSNRTEKEENVRFTIVSPYGEKIGVFNGSWEKAITEKPESKSHPNGAILIKHTFVGEIDDDAHVTFLARLHERRIFRNLLLWIQTGDGGRHRCTATLTVDSGAVKGVAIGAVEES